MTRSPVDGTHVRPLRRDAAVNREKLVEAAARVFAEHGLDATVEEVAREAGVGMGTLYRRFEHKQALIDELVGGVRLRLLELGRAALAVGDGTGLEQVMLETGQVQAEQSGCLQQLWGHSDAEAGALAEFRTILAQLLERAQQAGRVRTEITGSDLTTIMWSLRGVIEMTRDAAPRAWRRHLEVLVAGLRPPAEGPFDTTLREEPLSTTQARLITDTHRAR